MTVLRDNIAAFDRMRPELEAMHRNQWVLFHRGQLIGAYPDFAGAAASAETCFDDGPYLIRRVSAFPSTAAGRGVSAPAHAQA
jgi:hypothetical protein